VKLVGRGVQPIITVNVWVYSFTADDALVENRIKNIF
jgi:hypothetical protein